MGVKLFMGNVLQVVSGQVLACQAALIAGVPVAVPCTSVNKVCSSSMKSISMVAKAPYVISNHSMSPFYFKRIKLGHIKQA